MTDREKKLLQNWLPLLAWAAVLFVDSASPALRGRNISGLRASASPLTPLADSGSMPPARARRKGFALHQAGASIAGSTRFLVQTESLASGKGVGNRPQHLRLSVPDCSAGGYNPSTDYVPKAIESRWGFPPATARAEMETSVSLCMRSGRHSSGRKQRGAEFRPKTTEGSGPLSGRKLRSGPALWCPLFTIGARFLAPNGALASP